MSNKRWIIRKKTEYIRLNKLRQISTHIKLDIDIEVNEREREKHHIIKAIKKLKTLSFFVVVMLSA